ncbi:hypothetical protein Pcinc_038780 [Petrolisthes cinctipes]|uniref:Uncharacterized protein n=1 Tax=Petrolisthes cinctipes TaxID=88211 RepID=A0AAE1BPS7_PETCI|nr:hypothetical protein Pcinc_038780 [Petrolisthes cinctipes]
MTWRDSGYVEALQQETLILAKRVMAARSRVLYSTCFDTALTDPDPELPQDHQLASSLYDKDSASDISFIDYLSAISEEDSQDENGDEELDLYSNDVERKCDISEGGVIDAGSRTDDSCQSRNTDKCGSSEDRSLQRRVSDPCAERRRGSGGKEEEEELTAQVTRRLKSGNESMKAENRLSFSGSKTGLGDGMDLEDWRRLKESFIL